MWNNLRIWLWPSYVAWQRFTLWYIADIGCNLFIASFPALNVLIISYLAQQISLEQSLLLPLILLVLMFGASNMLQQLSNSNSRALAFVHENEGLYILLDKLETVPTYRYNEPQFIDQLHRAHGVYYYAYLSAQNHALMNVIYGVVSAISLCWTLWDYNHTVAIIALFFPIPLLMNTMIYGKMEARYWPEINRYQTRNKYLQSQLVLDRPGFDLATMNGGTALTRLAVKVRQKWLATSSQMHLYTGMFGTGIGILATIMYTVCLVILVWQGDFISLLAGIFGLTSTVNALYGMGYEIGMLAQCVPATRALYQFVHTDWGTQNPIDTSTASQVTFSNICVAYGDQQVVKGVDLQLTRNAITAIVGANGSGKTSLIKALMGIQPQASGQLTCGQSTYNLADKNYAVNYATVNQEFQKFDISIREFVTLGISSTPTDAQIWAALTQVEIADFVSRLPQGLDTPTGVQCDGIELSGGQWQRLCVARGLLARQDILFLDEPTSAIDAPTEERIFRHLAQVAQQRLVLLTTHRVATLQGVQNIYVMEDGKIVESGAFAELNQPGTKFRALFEAQFIGQTDDAIAVV